MIKDSIRLIILVTFIFSFIVVIVSYSNKKNLLRFNKIILEGNNEISSDNLFEIINYNIDSIESYNHRQTNKYISKIKEIENYDIINEIEISYSLPNKIIVNINEKDPVYIINNKFSSFAIDNNGQIFNTNFLSNDIHHVDLYFSVYEIYNEINNHYHIKDLFSNIINNKLNNEYLLNGLDILNLFDKVSLSNKIESILIAEHEISIDLDNTKIIFNHNELEKQFLKLKRMINNETFFDSLRIDKISDLSEINLSFNNQIVLKK